MSNDKENTPNVATLDKFSVADPTEAKLKLYAEDLSVDKKTVETGRIRVSTVTRERDHVIDEDLAHDNFEIETVPVGKQIQEMPAVRRDGDTLIVPVVEEVLFVERRLMLKEELRITRVHTTERRQETVKLRYQEAVVTRNEAPKTDSNTD